MVGNRTKDFWDGCKDIHVDTRHFKNNCEKYDPYLGCNLRIVVAG